MASRKKIVVFGGAFDPIHAGHLEAARVALAALGADRVYFAPTAAKAAKNRPLSPVRHRLALVRLATANEPRFSLSRFDADTGNVRSLNLMEAFRRRFPRDELFLLVGGDRAADFMTWHEPARIARICRVVYVSRPGQEAPACPLAQKLGAVACAASSTAIRSRADAAWQSRAEIDYVNAHCLYAAERVRARLSADRWRHSLRTARFARALAAANGWPDPAQAYAAGMFHDLAKEQPAAQLKAAAAALGIKKYTAIGTLHPFAAYKVMRDEYLWRDRAVLDAVYRHTEPPATGLTLLDKIVYVADKCEPARAKQDVNSLFDVKETARLAMRDAHAAFALVKGRLDAFWARGKKGPA